VYKRQVFSWDGNLTWDGIPLNTKRDYPQDLEGSKDGDRDMWSSALMCIHDAIGREATDSLLLEHFFYQGPNTTMPEMANIILQIDKSDFDSRYYNQLIECFVSAGFLAWGASVEEQFDPEYQIFNQLGFAAGTGSLLVNLNEESDVAIYDANGRIISSSKTATIELNPADYTSGLYVLRVLQNGQQFAIKIVR